MSRVDSYKDGWLSHRKALQALIETLENNNLSFKPWDNAMSLSELVLHISSSTSMFVRTVNEGIFTPPNEGKTPETVEELKQMVQSDTDKTLTYLESITEEQLNQLVEFSGMKMTGLAMLETAKDHEIHHKGQLFTYARLIGVEELPFFVIRG
ncbi:DinB family protein [Mesobacillus maritimus]|uniref:DinB family protein n=1 Tax=Mesobacillus maritimus TaxID=1643336 RepID=UPI00203E0D20|nr:DinB family protein [Mesobacillus maritimus]MCM3671760.1 DinB family protein [Mesobacillus maritimus]